MSWQQNVVLQRPVGASHRQEARSYADGNINSGDSSILRYIKTLTSHQTNAKQQRMDQYLRQVKHPPPAEGRIAEALKPQQTTGNRCPDASVSVLTPLHGPMDPFVLHSEPKARCDQSSKGKVYGRRSRGPSRAKRQSEGVQCRRQRKKAKAVLVHEPSSLIESLDRFRLNGIWSQANQQTATERTVEAKNPEATVQNGESKAVLSVKEQSTGTGVSTRNADTSETTKSLVWTSAASSRRSVGQVKLKTNSLQSFN
ncbi:unnamed protein product [Phytophthora fragariaefolia]|uniref:Unnamed protein product n=1 Tax=Phytophthora fragariaefolia TaxID=1490495 RepID=A0A9W6YET3_9STRA|nr:unnamed protein product [Phytophthora fragariaefolia]